MVRSAALALLASSSLTIPAHAQNAKLILLGSLGVADSNASDVSADGFVVVGWARTTTHIELFRWTPGTALTPLGHSTANNRSTTQDADVSGDGSVIIAAGDTNTYSGVVWRLGSGFSALPSRSPRGGVRPVAISADGRTIVGGAALNGNLPLNPAYWNETGLHVLSGYPGFISDRAATAVNADGSIIVGATESPDSLHEAIRWSPSGQTLLGDLPGSNFLSHPNGISNDGSTIVGYSNATDGPVAFRWTQATGMQALAAPAGYRATGARAASADGSVIITSTSAVTGGPMRAFFWTAAHGWRDLQTYLAANRARIPAGVTLGQIWDISADGNVIVGNAIIDSRNNSSAFVAYLRDPCYADFNRDGASDAHDLADFDDAFQTGMPDADFNRDDFIDFFDYEAFLNVFQAGC